MNFLPLLVALPLLGAFLIPILSKIWEGLSDLIANLIMAILLGLSLYALFLIPIFKVFVYQIGGWPAPYGIVFTFDDLSALIILSIILIAFSSSIFAIRYLEHYTARWKFYTLFLLMIAGLFGIALTGDLFNLFVFLEIAAISSYALVAFGTEREDLEAGFKYIVIGEVGGLTILLSIALIYAKASTLNMADLANTFANLEKGSFFWFVVSLLTFGFLIKAAAFPFHFWLPDAHSQAPAPISAMLSGIFVKVLGVYALARLVFNVFGLNQINAPFYFNTLIALGVLSIVIASLIALRQDDYKRLLAYSTISEIGYILVGLGIGNFYSIAGALGLIFASALGKGLLFLTGGAVHYLTGTTNLNVLEKSEISMPYTGLNYTLGALSLAGVPPFLGFFPKLLLLIGAYKAKMLGMAVFLAIFSIATLAYLLRITNKVFTKEKRSEGQEKFSTMGIAMVFLSLLLLLLGIGYVFLVHQRIIAPATKVLEAGIEYAKFVLGR